MTPDGQLFKAVKAGDAASVQAALAAGADVNARHHRERTPLHEAAAPAHAVTVEECIKVIELLIARGADVNARDVHQKTPLHRAAHLPGHIRIAELLIKSGADVNAKDDKYVTPLHNAAVDDLEKVARLLIKHGANIDAKDHEGCTPERRALARGNRHLADVLGKAAKAGSKAATGTIAVNPVRSATGQGE